MSASPNGSPGLPTALAGHPDYEIVRELGRGGMGVVYLARNRLTEREEALKVVARHILEKPGVRERFLREIRSVARLRHENVVAVHTAITAGDDLVCVMEYVQGQDLDRLVKLKGPLPVAAAANFVHQAALGLQHAHAQGVVHRDVKPGNLMLCRSGQRGVVKLLDFGLTKAAGEAGIDGSLTVQGQMMGTPDYIAPEQTLDAGSVDIRADIYSLGCTAYYLLSGGPPFRGSLYDILQSHHSNQAQPLHLARADVPAPLAALVAKMMAKDPADRFQTPGEVAKALVPFFKPGASGGTGRDQTLRDAPTVLPTASVDRPSPDSSLNGLVLTEGEPSSSGLSNRRPWVWPAVAGVVGCGVLGLAVASWRSRGPDGVAPALVASPAVKPVEAARPVPVETPPPTPPVEPSPGPEPAVAPLAAVVRPVAPEPAPTPAAVPTPERTAPAPSPAPLPAPAVEAKASPLLAVADVRRLRARPGVPRLVEPGAEVPIMDFWPMLTPENVKAWRIGDPSALKMVKKGLSIDAGRAGNFLVTKRDDYHDGTFSLSLEAAAGTEAYLALRAGHDDGVWGGVTALIDGGSGLVKVGGQSLDFEGPKTGGVSRSFDPGKFFNLEFSVNPSGEFRLLVNGKPASSGRYPGARPEGAVGLFVKTGRLVVSRLNVR